MCLCFMIYVLSDIRTHPLINGVELSNAHVVSPAVVDSIGASR